MSPSAATIAGRNPALWHLAKRRARFKARGSTFLCVNAMLWVIWALAGRAAHPVPWPLWATAFWGLGLLLQAFEVYGSAGRGDLAEREYARLTRPR